MKKIPIREKITLTEEEQKNLLLGNISAPEATETYKKAKKHFDERVEFLNKFATLSATETKMWFDYADNSCKMQYMVEGLNSEKTKEFEEQFKKLFKSMDKTMTKWFKDMEKSTEKFFRKTEPAVNEIFGKMDKLFNDLFGSEGKKK